MKKNPFLILSLLMANLFYVSCSCDDDFFYDSSEPYSEIALSKEYTNYCLLNHEINILINELDKADSIQEEKLKDQLNEMLIDYKYSKEVLFSKYTIFESFDVLQKEELYQYAISINSNLKALNKKTSNTRIHTRSGDDNPETIAQIHQNANWSKTGYSISYFSSFTSALDECERIGRDNKYGTFGYGFSDGSAMLFDPSNHKKHVTPQYPNDVLMPNSNPSKVYFFAFVSNVDGDPNFRKAQKDFINDIKSKSTVKKIYVICKRGESLTDGTIVNLIY